MKMDTIQPSQATIDACDPVEQLALPIQLRLLLLLRLTLSKKFRCLLLRS